MRIEIALRTSTGRAESQDRATAFARSSATVIVVADGAGGIAGGAPAAEKVLETARGASFDVGDLGAWSDLLVRVDLDLFARRAGESTAVIAIVRDASISGVAAGDSEAWLVGSRVDRLTSDTSRIRLGTGQARPAAFHRSASDGQLVVATDGLFRHVSEAVIVAAARAASAEALADCARMPRGAFVDDVAVVLASRFSLRPGA